MLTVSAGGYNARHPLTFFMSRPAGLNKYVLLLVKTKAAFTIVGQRIIVEPNHAILIDRNTPYQYQSVDGPYMDDWLHFDCTENAEECLAGLTFHQPFPVSNPARFTLYLQNLLWENSYTSPQYQAENVHMLLTLLLNHLRLACSEKSSARQYSPYYTRLQNIRLTIRTQPHKQYSSEQIAQTLGISLSYFQHLYSDFFGISFQADLIRLRIEHAKNMITGTDMTMEHIAEICGYASEVHFYRQFKKYVGMTPFAYKTTFGS